MTKTLPITLKRKWFDMIAAGIKLHEYREIKPYWLTRLTRPIRPIDASDYYPEEICEELKKFPDRMHETLEWGGLKLEHFDIVSANNGYQKDCPNVKWQHQNIRIGQPNPEWCEPEDIGKNVFILEIGELLKTSNQNY